MLYTLKESVVRKFTLIELLVVISIIRILTSILLPSLSKARDMGQTAVCAFNQKQIGVAVVSYIGEYDGIFPFGMTNDVATWTGTPNTDSQPPQQVLSGGGGSWLYSPLATNPRD